MADIKYLLAKSKESIAADGFLEFTKKTLRYVKGERNPAYSNTKKAFKDVLFINGCYLPHPQRYRVDHQIEQLEAAGLYCDRVDFDKIDGLAIGLQGAKCILLADFRIVIQSTKNNLVAFCELLYLIESP